MALGSRYIAKNTRPTNSSIKNCLHEKSTYYASPTAFSQLQQKKKFK